jgi:hypothetical protein
MSTRITATARVRITLDIRLTDSWGNDCSIEQIQKQATASVLGIFRGRVGVPHELTGAAVIGEPTVTAILVEQER